MLRLEVIDYFDPSGATIVARVPEFGTAAIQSGAKLLVQQNQEAVFFTDGRAQDQFGPGRYTLTTQNIPILTKLLTLPWEKSPFQACVYFVGRQQFLNQGWGTKQPITMKDSEFGAVRIRGYGKYSFRVTDSGVFVNEVVGTQGRVSTSDVSNYLRDVVVSGFSDMLATASISLMDLTSSLDELGAAARVKIGERFKSLGLELTDLLISNLSPPKEVQEAIDARSSMAIVGDLRSYTAYQAARGMSRPGAGGAGAAAGIAAGMMLPPILSQAMQVTNASAGQRESSKQQLDFSFLKDQENATEKETLAKFQELAQSNDWKAAPGDGGLQLKVQVGQLRFQTITVTADTLDEAGSRIVSITSNCGPATPAAASQLLAFNSQLLYGAFAIVDQGDAPQLVLRANLLADTLDALEITKHVSAIAWQADQLEQQRFGSDKQ
jgi:membrane protease subunit (stomatin/prohibitin family)